MSVRLRRSALYIQGSSDRAREQARLLPADCLTLDLEDAIAERAEQEQWTEPRQ